MDLRKVGIVPQHCTVSQPRRTRPDLTNYLMRSSKNMLVLIYLTQWHIISFAWRQWHMDRMRLSLTGVDRVCLVWTRSLQLIQWVCFNF
jgi:hypothetical protein